MYIEFYANFSHKKSKNNKFVIFALQIIHKLLQGVNNYSIKKSICTVFFQKKFIIFRIYFYFLENSFIKYRKFVYFCFKIRREISHLDNMQIL